MYKSWSEGVQGLFSRLKRLFPGRTPHTHDELVDALEPSTEVTEAYQEKMIQKWTLYADPTFLDDTQIVHRLKTGMLLPHDRQVDILLSYGSVLSQRHRNEMKQANYPWSIVGYRLYAQAKAASRRDGNKGRVSLYQPL